MMLGRALGMVALVGGLTFGAAGCHPAVDDTEGVDDTGAAESTSGSTGDEHASTSTSADTATSDAGSDETTGSSNRDLQVFVTRQTYNGDFGGLGGGDALCQVAAEAAGLQGTFVAWLSTDTVDAVDRLQSDGPWVRPDGVRVFDDRAHVSTTPLQTISIDEHGDPEQGRVWTGTSTGGQAQGDNCGGWTDAQAQAGVGSSEYTDSWTEWKSGLCENPAHLYCFEL